MEKTLFKDYEPMKGFSGLCQVGQCPHSDKNMLGNRNKEELVEKQVCQKGPRQSPDGCLGVEGGGLGRMERKVNISTEEDSEERSCIPPSSPRIFFTASLAEVPFPSS